jgi:serine/threonine protein kinase
MDKFKTHLKLGDGAYGTVFKSQNKKTHEIVAIKKMKRKFETWDECLALREIQSLRRLNHPNIVKLKEVIRERNELYLIFEFMDATVLDLFDQTKDQDTLGSVISQCLSGLAYCHS